MPGQIILSKLRQALPLAMIALRRYNYLMSYKSRIELKLASLAPHSLEVIDESQNHHGHSGWKDGGETHFRVKIVAAAFAGQNRLARHRTINALLASELAERVHALAIEARAPGE